MTANGNHVMHVENPLYSPDGEEPCYPRSEGTESNTQLYREPPPDTTFPHSVKFVWRRTLSGRCVIAVVVLSVVLIAVAIGIYFVVSNQTEKQDISIYTKALQIEFHIVNREFTSSLNNSSSQQFHQLSNNITSRLKKAIGNSTVGKNLDSVWVKSFSRGSIAVKSFTLFKSVYNSSELELAVEKAIRRLRTNSDWNVALGDLKIDSQSLIFKGIPLGQEPRPLLTKPTGSATIAVHLPITDTSTVHLISPHSSTHSSNIIVKHPSSTSSSHSSEVATATHKTLTINGDLPSTPAAPITTTAPSTSALTSSFPAAVIPPTTNPTVPVRLADGLSAADGYVELLHDGQWALLCDIFFDEKDAQVICRQLNYTGTAHVIKSSKYYWRDTDASWLDSIECDGTEAEISQCRLPAWKNETCSDLKHNAVICDYQHRDVSSVAARLVHGESAGEGRLEVFYHGQWGTVCDDLFEEQDAQVACSMLGYHTNSSSFTPVSKMKNVPMATGPIWLDNVECEGSESSLALCQHQGWGNKNCQHREDIYLRCVPPPEIPTPPAVTEPDISNVMARLVGGPSAGQGRLEVYYSHQWGTVCDDRFEVEDAKVACSMLGYPVDTPEFLPVHNVNNITMATGPIWLDGLECEGFESSLALCPHDGWGNQNCGHREDIYLRCVKPPENTTPVIPVTLSERPLVGVRLADGPDEFSGRVEVLFEGIGRPTASGQWGTVCRRLFTPREVTVLCRMLGYWGEAQYRLSDWGKGSGPILVSNLHCHGNETSIVDCLHDPWGQNDCDHLDDVSIQCRHAPDSTPHFEPSTADPNTLPISVETNITVATMTPDEEENITKSLTDSSNSSWTDTAIVSTSSTSEVTSSEHPPKDLNSTTEEMFSRLNNTGVSVGNSSVAMVTDPPSPADVTTMNILTERENFTGNASITDNVQTTESVPATTETRIAPPVRLAGGTVSWLGLVEIQYQDQWGYVCGKLFDDKDAAVVCRQLGYMGGTVPSRRFDHAPSSMWLTELACNGTEQDLAMCPHSGSWGGIDCWPDQPAAVHCIPTNVSAELPLRLIGTSDPYRGRLEVRYQGEWGTVCNKRNFAQKEARVVCHNLGFGTQHASSLGETYGPGTGRVVLQDLHCTGTETHPEFCQHSAWGEAGSCRNEAVSVYCGPPHGATDLRVRLEGGGRTGEEGRLEVRQGPSDAWGTVCVEGGSSFTDTAAGVVCRSIGLGDSGRVVQREGGEFTLGRVLMAGVSCAGNETSLFDCDHRWQDNTCTHSQDVYLSCGSHEADVALRLADGDSPLTGRLEVQHNGVWGTICDNFSFDEEDAKVACRQLGLGTEGVEYLDGEYGEGTGPIWLVDLECEGGETALTDCPHVGWGHHSGCDHYEDVSIKCGPPPVNDSVVTTDKPTTNARCEQIVVPQCSLGVSARLTALPGPPLYLPDQTSVTRRLAGLALLWALCPHPRLAPLLCALHLPPCPDDHPAGTLPCRFVCEAVQTACPHGWPLSLSCGALPVAPPCLTLGETPPWVTEAPLLVSTPSESFSLSANQSTDGATLPSPTERHHPRTLDVGLPALNSTDSLYPTTEATYDNNGTRKIITVEDSSHPTVSETIRSASGMVTQESPTPSSTPVHVSQIENVTRSYSSESISPKSDASEYTDVLTVAIQKNTSDHTSPNDPPVSEMSSVKEVTNSLPVTAVATSLRESSITYAYKVTKPPSLATSTSVYPDSRAQEKTSSSNVILIGTSLETQPITSISETSTSTIVNTDGGTAIPTSLSSAHVGGTSLGRHTAKSTDGITPPSVRFTTNSELGGSINSLDGQIHKTGSADTYSSQKSIMDPSLLETSTQSFGKSTSVIQTTKASHTPDSTTGSVHYVSPTTSTKDSGHGTSSGKLTFVSKVPGEATSPDLSSALGSASTGSTGTEPEQSSTKWDTRKTNQEWNTKSSQRTNGRLQKTTGFKSTTAKTVLPSTVAHEQQVTQTRSSDSVPTTTNTMKQPGSLTTLSSHSKQSQFDQTSAKTLTSTNKPNVIVSVSPSGRDITQSTMTTMSSVSQIHPQCLPLEVGECQQFYNFTRWPNVFGHNSTSDVSAGAGMLWQARAFLCHPQQLVFLCGALYPKCDSASGSQILPCRSFCEAVRAGCEPLLQQLGAVWPPHLSCSSLPASQPCVQPDPGGGTAAPQ